MLKLVVLPVSSTTMSCNQDTNDRLVELGIDFTPERFLNGSCLLWIIIVK